MTADPPLRMQCAWCGAATDGGPPPKPHERVSHGLCPACYAAEVRRLEECRFEREMRHRLAEAEARAHKPWSVEVFDGGDWRPRVHFPLPVDADGAQARLRDLGQRTRLVAWG